MESQGENFRVTELSEEELRQERAEKLVRFLDKLGAQKYFDTLEHKQAFIKQLTFEDFTNLLTHINGIVRELSIGERQIYQPVNVTAADEGWGAALGVKPSEMPPTKDKPRLLEYAFNRAKELEDPRDVGLLAAASINAVHPFGDGNGRTSRLVYDLLNYNYAGSERDKKFLLAALSSEGRFITPDVDPSYLLYGSVIDLIIKEEFTKLGEADYYFLNRTRSRDVNVRTDLDEETRDKLRFLLQQESSNDHHAVFLGMSRVLREDGRIADFVNHFTNEEQSYNRTPLDTELIVAKATKEDIDRFYDAYWQAKSDTVSNMVDQLTENRELPNTNPLEGLPARDFIRQRIASQLERNRSGEVWWLEDLAANWPEYPEETVIEPENQILNEVQDQDPLVDRLQSALDNALTSEELEAAKDEHDRLLRQFMTGQLSSKEYETAVEEHIKPQGLVEFSSSEEMKEALLLIGYSEEVAAEIVGHEIEHATKALEVGLEPKFEIQFLVGEEGKLALYPSVEVTWPDSMPDEEVRAALHAIGHAPQELSPRDEQQFGER